MTNADRYFRNASEEDIAKFLINFLCGTVGPAAIARKEAYAGDIRKWLCREEEGAE